MKLYLSSYRLGSASGSLQGLSGPGGFTLVPNALDGIADTEAREGVIRRTATDLESVGLGVDRVLDLRDFFGHAALLFRELVGTRNLFVTGGNVFVLRRAMAQSGLDRFLTVRAGVPDLLYAAYSAGACVCSPTLDGFELVDDPEVVPARYSRSVARCGLSLIPFAFIPHYRSDHPESAKIDRVVDYCTAKRIPFRAYSDGEVLVAEGRPAGASPGGMKHQPGAQ